jgi:integrase
MAKSRQRTGIESRKTVHGGERHRAAGIRVPGSNKRIHGPWRPTLAAAKADRARLLAQRDVGAGVFIDGSKLPAFEDAAEAWLAKCDAGEAWARGRTPYAARTLRDYRRDLDLYVYPAFGATPVDRLRRSTIQVLIDEIAAVHSGQRAKNVITPVRACYRWLLGRYDDLTDPTRGLDLPAGSKPRTRTATPQELRALIAALDVGDRAVLALAAYAGLRYGELRALRRGSVRLDGSTPEIAVTASIDERDGEKQPKTIAGIRTVPLFEPLRPILVEHFDWLDDDDDLLLPGQRTGHGYFRNTSFYRRAKAAWGWEKEDGKWTAARPGALQPIGLHEARHSFASNAIAAGYDPATVAAWLGHAQITTTLNRYVKSSPIAADPTRMNAWLRGDAVPEAVPSAPRLAA